MFFLTEKDESITKKVQRDPLGFQPIWSYFGSQVIGKITTVSNDIRGFREVLLCLNICEDYIQKKLINKVIIDKVNWNALPALILIFEELFIYSLIKEGRSPEGILGSDNGKRKFEAQSKDPRISPDENILANQLNLGYYGRYKTPMNLMGIIDGKSQIKISSDLNIESLYGKAEYNFIKNIVHNFFDIVIKNRKAQELSKFENGELLVNAILKPLNKNEKEFWKCKIGVTTKNDALYRIYNELNKKENSYQIIINKVNQEIDKSELKDVINIESFLIKIERVFRFLCKYDNVLDVQDALDKEIEEHKKAYDRINNFRNKSGNTSNLKNVSEALKNRFQMLINCNPNEENYVKKVYEYHREVCKIKKSSCWIEINEVSNKIILLNTDYNESVNDISEIETWKRNYYLESLSSLKRGLENAEG